MLRCKKAIKEILKITNKLLKKSYIQSLIFILGMILPKIFFWGPLLSFYEVDDLVFREFIIFVFLFFPVIFWAIFFEKITKKVIFIFFLLFFFYYFFIKIFSYLNKKIDFEITFSLRYFQYYSLYLFFNEIILFHYYPLITFGEFHFFLFKNDYPWIFAFFICKFFVFFFKKNYFIFILFLFSFFLAFFSKEPFLIKKNFEFPCKYSDVKNEFEIFIKNKKEKNYIFPETSLYIEDCNEILELKNLAFREKKNFFLGIVMKTFNERDYNYEKKNCLLYISEHGEVYLREKIKKIPFVEEEVGSNFLEKILLKKLIFFGNDFLKENFFEKNNIYICSEVLLSSFSFLKGKKRIFLLASSRWSSNFFISYHFKLVICYKKLIEKFNSCSVEWAFSDINFF